MPKEMGGELLQDTHVKLSKNGSLARALLDTHVKRGFGGRINSRDIHLKKQQNLKS